MGDYDDLFPLLVNSSDGRGGAAKAAVRLLSGFRQIGVDARMYVANRQTTLPGIRGPATDLARLSVVARQRLEAKPLRLYPRRQREIFTPGLLPNRSSRRAISSSGANIVNLHWVHDGMLGIADLPKIPQPIVWTLHDQWAFTGGCHYSADCTRYEVGCGSCPKLGSGERDLSRIILRRKMRAWRDLSITIVTPSRWLAGVARSSRLFGDAPIHVIPNGIDTKLYQPLNTGAARAVFGLPSDRFILLAGSLNAAGYWRKGLPLLIGALKWLAERVPRESVMLLTFGSAGEISNEVPFPSHSLGPLNDDYTLRAAYAAADLTVVPSMQDNLPNMVLESMACGTPVAGFMIGGIPDLVEHERTGYLAIPFEMDSLGKVIERAILRPNERDSMADEARRAVVRNFSDQLAATRYADLFAAVLDGTR